MNGQTVDAIVSASLKNTQVNKDTWGTIIYNVKAYGAKGDGATDDKAAIQATIDAASAAGGGVVFVPAGTYILSTHLVMKSNVILQGIGAGSILKMAAGSATNEFIILNANTGGAFGVYTDSYLELHDLVFDGNNIANCTAPLLNFIKAKYILIDNIVVQNHTHIGIDVAGCYQVNIVNSRFFNNGRPKPSTISAPAIHVYDNPGDSTKCLYIHVDKCHFEGNQWSGAYFMPEQGHIIDCVFINNGESSIYVGGGKNLKIIGNHVEGARKSNISATGIEVGGTDIIIAKNHIYNCEQGGVSVTDSQRVLIEGNIIKNNGLTTNGGADGITIISTSVAPNQPQHIKITGNTITDDQATKTQNYAVNFGTYSANVDYIQIEKNDMVGNKTGTIRMDTNWGANCYTVDNVGDSSAGPKVGSFTLPTVTGNFAVTGLGFKPRLIVLSGIEILSNGANNRFNSMVTPAASHCHLSAIYSTQSFESYTGNAITSYDYTGTKIVDATLVSMDKDGFTLNFLTANRGMDCMYTAYP